VAGSEPAAAPGPVAASEPAAAPEPVAVSEPAAAPEPVAASEPAAAPEPVAASEPAASPDPAASSEPVAASEPAASPDPAASSEPAAAPEATASPDAGAPAEPAAPVAEAPAAPSEPVAEAAPAADAPAAAAAPAAQEPQEEDEEEPPAPRERPAVPGADLEVDIVPEGVDPLATTRGDLYGEYEAEEPAAEEEADDAVAAGPIEAVIDLAAGARYRATGKRKTAIARVTLRPGSGSYTINGRTLAEFFPRETLQRNIRQPLETVGYEERMDVVARLHGGGVSSQAGALRHGISRALLEAEPSLRGELKRRGFLTRDARAKERKKAGLKKARKRPQFSKR
jgi:small subunit ribosomal protein S9